MLWPDIPYSRWAPTGASLHMWAQIVGKFRLAATPWINHSWQAAFYVNARGLTTSLVPAGQRGFEVQFDFVEHVLRIESTGGESESISLQPMSVSEFFGRFLEALEKLKAPTEFHGRPNEVPDPVPFARQTGDGAYYRSAVEDFWRALISIDVVFKQFRTGFLGKNSPVHLFWGSFDLAVTRFSGRPAPLHPGGVPALPDQVTREAYSHEVSSAGFWPGGGGIEYPAFYSYAYPTPDGFSEASPGHPQAFFDRSLGEFILPYDAVRTADDPEGSLLAFLQSTYESAATLGGWCRAELECDPGVPRLPRLVT
jgi:Family of unknown function (DUF5996)